MRGKIVNLCLGFLNLIFGILIIIYTIKVPQDKTLLTLQESFVINNVLIGIYIVMVFIAIIDLIQSFYHKSDTTFNVGYVLGIFVLSFYFFKQPFIAAFSILSGLIVLSKSLKENLIELNSTMAISTAITLIGATIVLGFFAWNYSAFGERIKNKENRNEQKYNPEFFKYITELDIPEAYINVKKDGKYGYINANGETKIAFEYDYASPFIKINSFGKNFYIALVCKDGSSIVILKNERKVMSYRSETADDNYSAKEKELEDIYYNTLQQTGEIEYEVGLAGTKNKVPAYPEDFVHKNIKTYNYNSEYDLIVTQSSMGRGDVYELSKKDNPEIKISLDTTNLDYDDNYLYLFSNGYIPFYEIANSTQGWFTSYGIKNEMTGKAQILDYFEDGRLIIRLSKDGSIYFSNTKNEKLSPSYFDMYICGDGRYIVKDDDGYFKIIDSEYNQVFEKKYAVINPRLVSQGLYLVLDSVDNIKFNEFDYAKMNWTLLNYNGEIIATDIENIYDINLRLKKEKLFDEENYLLFTTELKNLNYDFVGDKFYNKKSK